MKSGPSQKVLKIVRVRGKIDLFGALRGVPPMRGPPLREMYRAPAPRALAPFFYP